MKMTSRVSREQILKWYNSDEKESVEFKREPPDSPNKIWNTICAFANLDGGHIIFGIADDKEGKEDGKRKKKDIRRKDEEIKRFFNRVKGGYTKIKPGIEIIDPYEVEIEPDWHVVIIEVPKVNDPYLRICEDKPYTRKMKTEGDPETVVMDSADIFSFHWRKIKEQLIQLMGTPLKETFAEMAFRIVKTGKGLEKEEIKEIIKEESDRAYMFGLLSSHHLISRGPPEWEINPFVAQQLYSAFYLDRLADNTLAEILADQDWGQVVLIFVNSSPSRANYVINYFINHKQIEIAWKCFFNRHRAAIIDSGVKGALLKLLKEYFNNSKEDYDSFIIILELLRENLFNDLDDFILMEVLRILQDISLPLPVRFLCKILNYIDHDPNNPTKNSIIYEQCTRVIAGAKIKKDEIKEFITKLLAFMRNNEQYCDKEDFLSNTLEPLVVALSKYCSKLPANFLTDEDKQIISVALESFDRFYEYSEIQPAKVVKNAIKKLHKMV